MKNNIINRDKDGNRHGVQIDYDPNGNIKCIGNYHHGISYGYSAWFKSDNSIEFKEYRNMGKWIYEEDHEWNKQIEIKI